MKEEAQKSNPSKIWDNVRKKISNRQYEQAYILARPMIEKHRTYEFLPDYIQILLKLSMFSKVKIWLNELAKAEHLRAQYYLLQGHLNYKLENWTLAAEFYNKHLAIDPKSIYSRYNLAMIKCQIKDFESACHHFKACEQITKNLPPSFYQNYGMALVYNKDIKQATVYLTQAIKHNSEDTEICFHLGLCYQLSGQIDEALKIYTLAIKSNPHHTPSLHNLATINISLNKHSQALEILTNLNKLQPQDIITKTLLDALTKRESHAHHPTFIKTLFDQYAFNYDTHLSEQLKYNPFHFARNLMNQHLDIKQWNCGLTLDLGCGTGLAAPYFTELSYRMIGVDLSEGMLMQAKKKGFYDEVSQDDVFRFLDKQKVLYKLALSFELSNYIGKKIPLLIKKIEKKMLPGGVIVMTFEKNITNYEDVFLNDRIRFTFSFDYAYESFVDNGLQVLRSEEIVIRQEVDHKVEGFIFVGQKI